MIVSSCPKPQSAVRRHHGRATVRERISRVRVLAGSIATIATLALISQAEAAQFIYTPVNGAGDLWSAAGANWSAAPVSAADTRLTFVGANGTVLADGLTNTNTNDLTGQFQLNILDLLGTGSNAGVATININSASPATGLSLVSNGSTTPVVNLDALAGVGGLTYNVNPTINLDSNTTFQGAGTATFNFAGGLNGSAVTLTKAGASVLTLGGNTTLGSLTIGNQSVGGTLVTAAGAILSIGNGSSSSVLVGGGGNSTSFSGVLDVSNSSGFTANVGNFSVSYNTAGSPPSQSGVLKLGTSNFITALSAFRVGQSDNQPTGTAAGAGGNLTTAALGFTTINTPKFTVGTGKSSATVTLGTGSIFNLSGVTAGARTEVVIGSNTINTSSSTNTIFDASAAEAAFNGVLSTLLIGNSTNSNAGTVTASMLLSDSALNHLDLNGSSATNGGVLVIGRHTVNSTSVGVATGTLTIGNLDFSSKIVSSNNGTGILIGQAGSAGKAVGTLNLNGGTLLLTTTGSAIAGGANGTSTVNFNGTALRAGASSASWITGLTNANVSTGGVKIDTNGFTVTVGQAFAHASALGATLDGGLTKSGSGTLTLTGANTYTGATIVEGGMLFATKTAALPNYSTTGAVSVLEGGGLGLSIGGAGEFTLADVEMFRTNGTFQGTHSLGFDTSNSGGDLTYTSSVNTLFSITKLGATTLTLGNNATTLGSVNVGINKAGGTLAVANGTTVSVGTGMGENLNIGVTNTPTQASGVFDVSAAASFTANVGSIVVGSAGNNSVTGQGTLILPANNSITATNSFVIATSSGMFNNVNSSVTTGAGGLTTIQTPSMTIGGTKSRGFFTLGAGSTLELAGTFDGRTSLAIGRSAIEGGTGEWSGTADFSAGTFKGNLSSLVIGYTDAGSSGSWSEAAALTLSSNAANHLDISGSANPVIIGRWINGTATTSSGKIAAVGTLTIGNLDSTSSIVAFDDSTAILLGTGGVTGTQRASGTLNLNGGTLTITTAGTAIGGDTANSSNTSTVNFNGTLLKAGASSANWISGLTNANVSTGGAKFDTNGNDITIPQALIHDAALTEVDGGLSKSGDGTLTLSGVNTYTGATTVTGGTLLVTGSISGSATTVASGGTLGGVGGIVGATTVAAGGTLAPGASSAGTSLVSGTSIGTLNFASTLTLAGTATFEINKAGISLSADLANVGGALTLGGNLTVVLTGDPLLEGDVFNLFDAASFSGSFASFTLPALDPGLSWDTTQLATNGTLAVVPEPGSAALLLSVSGALLGLRRFRRRMQA